MLLLLLPLLLLLLLQRLLPVRPRDFYAVLVEAAAAGRMDYVRMLMTAADQQMREQVGIKYQIRFEDIL